MGVSSRRTLFLRCSITLKVVFVLFGSEARPRFNLTDVPGECWGRAVRGGRVALDSQATTALSRVGARRISAALWAEVAFRLRGITIWYVADGDDNNDDFKRAANKDDAEDNNDNLKRADDDDDNDNNREGRLFTSKP
jgi:hypothetical protein